MKAVKAGWLVCAYNDIKKDYGLIIEGDIIKQILSNQEIDQMIVEHLLLNEEVLDKQNAIVLPGFVNAHMHQYGLLSHGIQMVGKVVDFDSFLSNYWWPFIENRIYKAQVLATAKASMAEMLHSGITAFCDTLEAPFTEPDTLIEQGKLIESVGMRAIVSLESSERVSLENGERCLQQNGQAVDYFHKRNGLVKAAICTHTTFTCSDDFIKKAATLAMSKDAIFQFHLSESRYEPEKLMEKRKQKPVHLYNKLGAFPKKTIASQCVKVDDEEIGVIQLRGVNVVHMPISNCEVGGGIAPIPRMRKQGIKVSLGTDGYINDFFLVMKEAFLIHKAYEESTKVMPASEVFRMATEYGAEAMGLKDCGLLMAGYQADFVVYEEKFPTPLTKENIVEQLVVFGDSHCVSDVFVRGKGLMQNGVIVTFDETKALNEMKDCANDFWKGVQ
ncbi:MAG: amidohydrolase family protein [Velocimicrobium sp.]